MWNIRPGEQNGYVFHVTKNFLPAIVATKSYLSSLYHTEMMSLILTLQPPLLAPFFLHLTRKPLNSLIQSRDLLCLVPWRSKDEFHLLGTGRHATSSGLRHSWVWHHHQIGISHTGLRYLLWPFYLHSRDHHYRWFPPTTLGNVDCIFGIQRLWTLKDVKSNYQQLAM